MWLRAIAAIALLVQPLMMPAATPLNTRVITVQVLDSNNGRAVSADNVQVECRNGLDRCDNLRVVSNSTDLLHGTLRVVVPAEATALVVNPAANRIEPCGGSDDRGAVYGVNSIEASGVVGGNDCHSLPARTLQSLSPQPGTLVVFVHHKPVCRRALPFC